MIDITAYSIIWNNITQQQVKDMFTIFDRYGFTVYNRDSILKSAKNVHWHFMYYTGTEWIRTRRIHNHQYPISPDEFIEKFGLKINISTIFKV
jgi:hypothetical protein